MSTTPRDPGSAHEEYESAVNEITDPIQLLPYLPENVKATLSEHYAKDKLLFLMDESKLERHLHRIDQQISNRDDALRARFWFVYDLCAYDMRKMVTKEIFAGIMGESTFYTQYIKNRFKMAWMVCKPTELRIQDLASITAGKRKMDAYLRMDAVDPVTKRIDYKLVALQLSIYKNLESRVFGLPVQQIVQKNINTEVTNKQMAQELENKDATYLRDKLQDLKTMGTKVLPVAALPSTPDSSSGPLIVEDTKNE